MGRGKGTSVNETRFLWLQVVKGSQSLRTKETPRDSLTQGVEEEAICLKVMALKSLGTKDKKLESTWFESQATVFHAEYS